MAVHPPGTVARAVMPVVVSSHDRAAVGAVTLLGA